MDDEHVNKTIAELERRSATTIRACSHDFAGSVIAKRRKIGRCCRRVGYRGDTSCRRAGNRIRGRVFAGVTAWAAAFAVARHREPTAADSATRPTVDVWPSGMRCLPIAGVVVNRRR